VSLFDREIDAAEMIPITSHVDPFTVRMRGDKYGFVVRLRGISFESADDDDINNWHERLNVFLRSIASPNWAMWTHVVRRRDHARTRGTLPPGFARDLDAKYGQKLAGETLMVNDLYLSLVYKPQTTAAGVGAMKIVEKTDAAGAAIEMADSIEQCTKMRQAALASLDRYDPEPLGIYVHDGRQFSSVMEFYAFLVNGEWQRMPLPRAPIHDVIATSHHLFGVEAMEYRTATRTRYGAFLGIKEYPTPTAPGMFAPLLHAPFQFRLTQSFAFIPKAVAVKLMDQQIGRMNQTNDAAKSQRNALLLAQDALISNEFVIGDHHFTLHVLDDAFDGVKEAEGAPRLKRLNDNIAAAQSMLSDTGMVAVREGALAIKSAFWAQLPGNFQYRTRKSPITSRNFAGMNPFFNFPTGRETGNHWGDALTIFLTSALSALHFSPHASDPKAPDGGSRKDVGHMVGIGPVGSGKTTVIGFLLTQVLKFGATQIVFDKDEGLHILVKALGGEYLPLKNGRRTGFNPLQLDPTPDNIEFWRQWLRDRVRRSPTEALSSRHERDLDEALSYVTPLPVEARRLSRLLEFLDPTEPEGMHARLLPWCGDGPYGWVADNPTDLIAPLLRKSPLVGFDVTDFLDNATVRPAVTSYLFHLVQQMVDGRRLVVWADEFSKLLDSPAFSAFAKDSLQVWRKKNACFVAMTQQASHVLGSDIARSVIEQTPTKLIWPNPDADYDEYTRGFGLSDREFRLIKQELEPGSRSFLIKQGRNSVVVKLDLKGFDFELDVISGRTSNVALMHRLIAQHGPAPEAWLPAFRAATSGKPFLVDNREPLDAAA
jgi:type IV secretion system protein VirB4